MTQLPDHLHWRIKDLEARKSGFDFDVSLPPEFLSKALADTDTDVAHSAAAVKGHLDLQHDCVLCRGTLVGELHAPCQRCLQPAQVPVNVSLNMTFVPAGASLPVRDDEAAFDPFDPDDVDYAHHDREVVDLRPVIREHLLLSLPITVLCQEDCRGLCPSCGTDLNSSTCACERAVTLSSFAALANLKV